MTVDVKGVLVVTYALVIVSFGFFGAGQVFSALPPSRSLLAFLTIAALAMWIYGEGLRRRDLGASDRFLWLTFTPVALALFGFLMGIYWRWWR